MTKPSPLESRLALAIQAAGLPSPERELAFHPERRWRFDFAWPEAMVALEVEGGTWVRGRHTRGKGFEADAEKKNAATLLGWSVYTVTGNMIKNGEAIKILEKALEKFYA